MALVTYTSGQDDPDPIVLNTDDFELLVASGTAIQSGVISESGGSFGFEKTGDGTLKLSATNSYTGTTNITDGSLNVTGSTTAPVTVESGGTLSGTGTVGAVTVDKGGTLSPGDGNVGALSTGSLSFAKGATFSVATDQVTDDGGVDASHVNVTGTVTLGDASFDLSFLISYVEDDTYSFTVIDNDGTDAVSGEFNNYMPDYLVAVGNVLATINYEGGDGNDVVVRIYPASDVEGSDGDDIVDVSTTVSGQPYPTAGSEAIYGKGGDDRLSGLGGRDLVLGGSGDDVIKGGGGRDLLKGGKGDDLIIGGAGEASVARARGESDVLVGGRGDDRLKGGAGIDTFVFQHRGDLDRILDYEAGETLLIARKAFPGIGPTGALKAKHFHAGSEAETKDHRFVYNAETGWLSYARRGSETADPKAFVMIGKSLDDFDRHDILVI